MRSIAKALGTFIIVIALVLGILLAGVYFVYLRPIGEADPAGYAFDLAKVRELADSISGEKVTEIRAETIASFNWPELITMAGGGAGLVQMGCYSYQLVTPTGHHILDTGMDSTIAGDMPGTEFFAEGYDRMQRAIGTADIIAITHEHPDHLGGLTKHPDVKSLHAALRLTDDQISDPARHKNPEFAPGALDGYTPLKYDEMVAIGPGVVLIKASGHTHGSQMVFIEMADGREVLFLGDVAWMWNNVVSVRPRPRLVSEFVLPGGEDAGKVLAQLQFLNKLSTEEPGILQIPGHDLVLVESLFESGVMKLGFVEPTTGPDSGDAVPADPAAASEPVV